MASWVACPDGSFVQIAQLLKVEVDPNTFNIIGLIATYPVYSIVLKTGFSSLAAAQAALTTAIGNLGGTI